MLHAHVSRLVQEVFQHHEVGGVLAPEGGLDFWTSYRDHQAHAVRVFVPNAFSPNGDGMNDVLILFSPGDVQQVKSFRIFDRWGELVFNRQNFLPNYAVNGWDGRFQGQKMGLGVYVYMAEVLLIDGRIEVVSGDVTLIR